MMGNAIAIAADSRLLCAFTPREQHGRGQKNTKPVQRVPATLRHWIQPAVTSCAPGNCNISSTQHSLGCDAMFVALALPMVPVALVFNPLDDRRDPGRGVVTTNALTAPSAATTDSAKRYPQQTRGSRDKARRTQGRLSRPPVRWPDSGYGKRAETDGARSGNSARPPAM